ncbi:MAG TPA: helix-turn-helix domain-containing protein [Chloroflexota bacterium]
MAADDLLTVPQVAAQLKVTGETVREWLRTGILHGYNLGGQAGWRIPPSEIARLLESKTGKRRSRPTEPQQDRDRQ